MHWDVELEVEELSFLGEGFVIEKLRQRSYSLARLVLWLACEVQFDETPKRIIAECGGDAP